MHAPPAFGIHRQFKTADCDDCVSGLSRDQCAPEERRRSCRHAFRPVGAFPNFSSGDQPR